MVDGLFDTSIVIDLIRQHQPAEQWVAEQTNVHFGISAIVWLEVLDGARN